MPTDSAKLHNPNWDDLHCFTAVAQDGSVGAAARRLGVDHSTVLRRLARLEQRLQARLFERFPSGYQLTPEGEELRDRLLPLADQIDAIQRQMAGRNAELAGTIRLTTTDTLLHGLLAPVLARFRQRHPGIQLDVVVNNSFLHLTRREADVAVRPARQVPDLLVGRRVGAMRTAVYAARGYLEQAGAGAGGADAQDWAALDWVVPGESLAHLRQVQWLRAHVPPARHAFAIDTLLGMLTAVRSGLGAGLLLTALADGLDDLVRLADPEPQLDTPVWVLTHADLRQVQRIRAFTAFLVEALSAHPALNEAAA
jgi:DNA-binding transcriptional LysR family regulator